MFTLKVTFRGFGHKKWMRFKGWGLFRGLGEADGKSLEQDTGCG